MNYRRPPQLVITEASTHELICDYLRVKFPGTVWRTDFASGLRLKPYQAVMHKRLQSSRAWPDLLIYEPIGAYQGLALEIKKEGVKTHNKDGSLRADPHFREQDAMLARLRTRGYKAEFAHGFAEARQMIDTYFASRTERRSEPF